MTKKSKLFLIVFFIILNISHSEVEAYEGGQAYVVMDVETGRVMLQKNVLEQLPMASTTKIMTALLAIENVSMDKVVTIHPKAVGIEGSSIYLEANEKVKMIDLLYGLMLRSGNDAAAAIAYEISGSEEDFAKLMNNRVKEIGANNTHFMNPHGLHHNGHYTTAYDLALITREALKNPIFKEIVNTKFWIADREGYKYFANKNKILSMCEGGDGVKTGYTTRAGRCLVASATRNNMQFIAVTLNDNNWFDNAAKLIDACFEQYKPHRLFQKEEKVKRIAVKDGKPNTIYLTTANSVVIPLKEGEKEKLVSVIQTPQEINAPVIKGQKIGKIRTYLNGELINITDLIAGENVEKLTLKDKILKFFKR